LCSSNLYSHPDKKLIDHLQNVANQSTFKLQRISHNLHKLISLKHLENLLYILGFVHDFGKSTAFFQEYLFEKNEKIKLRMKNDERVNHSLISSVFVYLISKEYVKTTKYESDLYLVLPLFLFLIVKRHHGNIHNVIPSDNFASEIGNFDFEKLKDVFSEQINSINPEEL